VTAHVNPNYALFVCQKDDCF